MSEKLRLDILIKERYNLSREYSKTMINEGNVSVNGKIIYKCSFMADSNDDIKLNEKNILKYVGRGGLKLEKALKKFNIDIKEKVCIDVGASTGGFTDCMIQNGALKVYAIDVGSSQLSEKLVNNTKIISMENTNIKDVSINDLEEYADFASIDVSFISILKILNNVCMLLNNNGEIMALIKPQFEAGRKNINKNGIVKNSKVHETVIKNICSFCSEIGLNILNLDYSPIRGGNGNIEYLIYLSKNKKGFDNLQVEKLIKKTVSDSHKLL